MPLYQGKNLVAGNYSDSLQDKVYVKKLNSTTNNADDLAVLNEAWSVRSQGITTIIYFINNGYIKIGVIDLAINPTSTTYLLNLTDSSIISEIKTNDGVTNLVKSEMMLNLTLSADKQSIVSYSVTFNNNKKASYLETNVDYATPYTPKYNGSPATKKYVDDLITTSIGDVEISDIIEQIFYWDGKSDTDNIKNIELWQNIINKCQEGKACLVFSTLLNDTTAYKSSRGVFIVDSQVIKSGYNVIDGCIINNLSENVDTISGLTTFKWNTIRVEIEISSAMKVTKVYGISFPNKSSTRTYLPTNYNTVKNYIPTYDYHPATKKYVDDKIVVENTQPTVDFDIWIDESKDASDDVYEISADLLDYYRTSEIDDMFADYLPLSGGTMTGAITSKDIFPAVNNTQSIGTSSFKFQNMYATTFNGALNGNANTSTKLKTARKINGVLFDGSADITIDTVTTQDTSLTCELPTNLT